MVFQRKIRKRFFVGVEGESEQAFVKWIQGIANAKGLFIHLDCYVLNGGGYKSLLDDALIKRKKGLMKGHYLSSVLIVDSDRSLTGDWSCSRLTAQAGEKGIIICYQIPNMEGVLYRLHPGNEKKHLNLSDVARKLKKEWPDYQKPVNYQTLFKRFSYDDLLNLSKHDKQFNHFFQMIGLIH